MDKDRWIRFSFQFDSNTEFVYTQNESHLEIFLRQHNLLRSNQSFEEFRRMNYIEYNNLEYFIFNNTETNKSLDADFSEGLDIPHSIEGRILQEYKFKSNKSTESFLVYTNDYLVVQGLYHTANELSRTLIFGSAIMKTEFGFIKEIADCIDALPKAFVVDYERMEELSYHYDNYYDYTPESKYAQGKKEENSKNSFLTPNVYSQYYYDDERLFRDSYFDEALEPILHLAFIKDSYTEVTQPITIEAYVSVFTRLFNISHQKGGI